MDVDREHNLLVWLSNGKTFGKEVLDRESTSRAVWTDFVRTVAIGDHLSEWQNVWLSS